MQSKTRQKFWKYHSIFGIILGVPLFIIFFAGSFAFFEPESINWTYPELTQQYDGSHVPLATTIEQITSEHSDYQEITVVYASESRGVTDIYYKEGNHFGHQWVIPHSGEIVTPPDHDEEFFHFLVDLHYLNISPAEGYGRYVAGIIAMLFVSIIVTGILYQLRGLKKDLSIKRLFSLKRGFWKNWHRTASFLTMPFQFMFALTGAVLGIGLISIAPAITLFFEGDQQKLEEAIFPARGVTAELVTEQPVSIDDIYANAKKQWKNEVDLKFIQMIKKQPSNTASSEQLVYIVEGMGTDTKLNNQYLLAYSEDGKLLDQAKPGEALGSELFEGMLNLHFANFGNFNVKIIYAIIGILTTFSIACGVLILTSRLSPNKTTWKMKVFKALVLGTLFGIPLGTSLGFIFLGINAIYTIPVFGICYLVCILLLLFFPYKSIMQAMTILFGIFMVSLPIIYSSVNDMPAFSYENKAAQLATFLNSSAVGIGLMFFIIAGWWIAYPYIKNKQVTAR